jgi:transposase
MTQHTSRLCKGFFTEKESDRVLHQMTWPPQSPDLNPIEIVCDVLDHRVKEKQPTSDQYMSPSRLLEKLVERMPRVCKAVIKVMGGYFKESQM